MTPITLNTTYTAQEIVRLPITTRISVSTERLPPSGTEVDLSAFIESAIKSVKGVKDREDGVKRNLENLTRLLYLLISDAKAYESIFVKIDRKANPDTNFPTPLILEEEYVSELEKGFGTCFTNLEKMFLDQHGHPPNMYTDNVKLYALHGKDTQGRPFLKKMVEFLRHLLVIQEQSADVKNFLALASNPCKSDEDVIKGFDSLGEKSKENLCYLVWWHAGDRDNSSFGELCYGENRIRENPRLFLNGAFMQTDLVFPGYDRGIRHASELFLGQDLQDFMQNFRCLDVSDAMEEGVPPTCLDGEETIQVRLNSPIAEELIYFVSRTPQIRAFLRNGDSYREFLVDMRDFRGTYEDICESLSSSTLENEKSCLVVNSRKNGYFKNLYQIRCETSTGVIRFAEKLSDDELVSTMQSIAKLRSLTCWRSESDQKRIHFLLHQISHGPMSKDKMRSLLDKLTNTEQKEFLESIHQYRFEQIDGLTFREIESLTFQRIDVLTFQQIDCLKILLEEITLTLGLQEEDNAKKILDIALQLGSIDIMRLCCVQHPKFKALLKGHFSLYFSVIAINTNLMRYFIEEIEIDINKTKPLKMMFFFKILEKIRSSVENEAQFLSTFKYLLDKGADPKAPNISRMGYFIDFIEFAYFELSRVPKSRYELIKELVERRGCSISATMQRDMIRNIQKEPAFGKLLVHAGNLTQEDLDLYMLPPSCESSAEVLQKRMLENKTALLDNVLQLDFTKYFMEDYDLIEECKKLKKETKLYLKTNEDPELTASYNEFCRIYDQVVERDDLLATLQKISRELRKDSSVSKETTMMLSLWSEPEGYDKDPAFFAHKTELYRPLRTDLLREASHVHKDIRLFKEWIHLVHGTRLTPPMLTSGMILPMGMLLERRIIPFNGETSGSEKSRNKEHTCFSLLTSSCNNRSEHLYGVNTALLVSIVYAQQWQGDGGSYECVFDREETKKRLTIASIEKAMRSSLKADSLEHTLLLLNLDIWRLRSVDPGADAYLEPVKEWVTARMAGDPSLKCIHKALTDPVSKVDPSQMDLLEKPISILFGTGSQPYIKGSDTNLEKLVHGELRLGKDLPVAFVSKEDVERASSYLASLDVRVYSLETAKYLESQRMIEGSKRATMERAIADYSPVAKTQARIGYYLQNAILPVYGKPFPSDPTYREGDEEKPLASPFYGEGLPSYEAYKEGVDSGSVIPRVTHGKMHAVRTCIASQILAKIYAASPDEIPEDDILLLSIAAAAHDWMRGDEGEDRWDEDSAQALYCYLLSLGYEKEHIERYVHALKEKDPAGDLFTFLTQKIIHDGDCLEIMRVLEGKKDFDPQQLQFYHLTSMEKADKDAFIDEWYRFIKLTDSLELKMQLESHPGNYYSNVMGILRRDQGDFPILSGYLKEELKAHPEFRETESA